MQTLYFNRRNGKLYLREGNDWKLLAQCEPEYHNPVNAHEVSGLRILRNGDMVTMVNAITHESITTSASTSVAGFPHKQGKLAELLKDGVPYDEHLEPIKEVVVKEQSATLASFCF